MEIWPRDSARRHQESTSQRNLSYADLSIVMKYGQEEINTEGALYIFLRQKDIPHQFKGNKNIMRLADTAIVISSDCDQIITTYLDRNALRIESERLRDL